MRNLCKISENFVKRLNEDGFNGVYIHAYTENEYDPAQLDGQPQEILDECNRHYAIFVIEPDFGEDIDDDCTPYVSSREVDYEAFWNDMKKEMKRVFGNDVKIECVGYGGQEFEVTREKSYKKAWAKYEKWYKQQRENEAL